MRPLTRSQAWWALAERVISLNTQTLSKSPTEFVQGVLPTHLQRGRGSNVWDVAGAEYIDDPIVFVDSIQDRARPPIDGTTALGALRLADLICVAAARTDDETR